MLNQDPLLKVPRLEPNVHNIRRSLEAMKYKYIEQEEEFNE